VKTDNRLESVASSHATDEWLYRADPYCQFCETLITPGDVVHYVSGLGWTCGTCAKPAKS
jgi:hypothetical protein